MKRRALPSAAGSRLLEGRQLRSFRPRVIVRNAASAPTTPRAGARGAQVGVVRDRERDERRALRARPHAGHSRPSCRRSRAAAVAARTSSWPAAAVIARSSGAHGARGNFMSARESSSCGSSHCTSSPRATRTELGGLGAERVDQGGLRVGVGGARSRTDARAPPFGLRAARAARSAVSARAPSRPRRRARARARARARRAPPLDVACARPPSGAPRMIPPRDRRARRPRSPVATGSAPRRGRPARIASRRIERTALSGGRARRRARLALGGAAGAAAAAAATGAAAILGFLDLLASRRPSPGSTRSIGAGRSRKRGRRRSREHGRPQRERGRRR